MDTEASDQEQRIRALADSTRNYLTALNTGGIGVSFAVAGALASNGVEPRWVIWPVVFFVLGLITTAVSHFLSRLKHVMRRRAARKTASEANFDKLYWSNFTYEFLALLFFVIGVIWGLWELSYLRLSPT